MRIGVVLGAGGLRGAAHAGVLKQLVRHGVLLHTIVGVSAGVGVPCGPGLAARLHRWYGVIPDRLRGSSKKRTSIGSTTA